MPITGNSIYIHIPFCRKKCPYCHFYSVYPKNEYITAFENALLKEIIQRKPTSTLTIYFGGGTPSIMDVKFFEKILKLLPHAQEITIEANPLDISLEKVKHLKDLGINRISLGIQSFDDQILKILQRKHSSKDAIIAIENIVNGGIENISIDLMYDIPDQTLASFKNSLITINHFPIKHISLYNLTIEENTPFYKEKEKLLPRVANEQESLIFLKTAISYLKSIGFQQYEISAFAKKGFKSQHNLGYWLGREFFGFGPSAFSYINGKRFKNVTNLLSYIKNINNDISPIDFIEKLEDPHKTRELLTINLRILSGLNLKKFPNLDLETFNILETLKSEKLLKQKKNKISLTKKGLLFYDTIAERLI